MRYVALTIFISGVIVYAQRDWFRALCILITMVAIMERPDFPRAMFEIPGLNPYNLVLLSVLVGFFRDKVNRVEYSVPVLLRISLVFFFVVLISAFLRLYLDREGIHELRDYAGAAYPTSASLAIRYLIDPIRFLLPGFLLSMGMRSSEHVTWIVYAMLFMGLLLALQIIVKMIPSLLGGEDLADRALRVISRDVGFHRVEASTLTGLFTSAFLAAFLVVRKASLRFFMGTGFVISFVALAATGGRAGMLASGIACFVLLCVRGRVWLAIAPVLGVALFFSIPGLQDRMLEGVSAESEREVHSRGEELGLIDESGVDLYAVTSGRAAVWPLVIDKITESPWIGHGRSGMTREGITLQVAKLLQKDRFDFGHPHNAYLEIFLDAGVIGALPILLGFIALGIYSLRSFSRKDEPDLALIGGITFAMLMTYAVAGIGSGSFFPQLRVLIMYCAIGAYLGWRFSMRTSDVSQAEESTATSIVAQVPTPLWQKHKFPTSRWSQARL